MQDLAGLAMQALVAAFMQAQVVDFMVALAAGFTVAQGAGFMEDLEAACTAAQAAGFMEDLGEVFTPALAVEFMLARLQMIKMHIVVLGDHASQEQQKTTGLGQIVPTGVKDKEDFRWNTPTKPRGLTYQVMLKI
jgi:hypothetical protein